MNFDKIADAQLKGIASLVQADLIYFIKFFFKLVEGEKFAQNWHHTEIAKELTAIYERQNDNLIINMPPRHSKTTMSCYFTAWALAKNPKSLFLYISGSEKLTNDNSRLVRSIIMHPIYKRLFGVDISQDTTAKNHWRTVQGGGITTATINGQITGFGAGNLYDDIEFYGAIIIDDPNKISTAESLVMATEPNERFNDTIRSRRNGKRTPIIVIQQRVFVNDLSGFLLAGGGAMEFKHISFPVIKDGAALWPERMGLAEIESIKKNIGLSAVFSAQYMQEPAEMVGTLFMAGTLKYFNPGDLSKKTPELCIGHIDVADQGNDYLCFVLCKVFGQRVFITDVVYSKEGERVTRAKVSEKLNTNFAETCLVESNNQGKLYGAMLKDMCENTRIVPYAVTTNKDLRIFAQHEWIAENVHFIAPEYQGTEYSEFMRALTTYNSNGKNENDDAPDSLAGLAKYLRTVARL